MSMLSGKSKWAIVPYLLIASCAVLFIYLNIVRIVHVPVTYDEGYTYNVFASKSYGEIISYGQVSANNHMLNSVLTRFFTTSFVDNVFSLRLANLIGQVIFILFSVLICNLLFKNKWLVVAGFLLLNLHPFLFQFWGLCRGYGLSIGFMSGSIYFLMRYLAVGRKRFFILCMFFCIAAILANLTLLNLFPAIFFVILAHNFAQRHHGSMKRFFITDLPVMLGTAVTLFLLIAKTVKKLKEGNNFFYGGDDGIFTDTVRSLIQDSFFLGDGDMSINLLSIFCVGVVIVMSVYLLWLHIRRKTGATNMDTFFLLLAIPLLSIQLQHNLFGTKFVISRTALFLLPLYILLLLAFIQQFSGKWGLIILFSITAIFSINFIKNYNIYETRTWPLDRYDLAVMRRIVEGDKITKVSLGSCTTPVFEYYASTYFKNRFSNITGVFGYRTSDTLYDYYYIEKSSLSKMPPTYVVDTIFGDDFALIARRAEKTSEK